MHPYYKLDYIGEKWGGEQEQQAEIAAGNIDAIDWKKYAHEVVDKKVRARCCSADLRDLLTLYIRSLSTGRSV